MRAAAAPYQCSFCTIINVQGRKSRFRSADDVEHLVRLNWAQGIHKFFIHRRQFCAQQGMGIDLRPPDRAARERRNPARPHDPGRYIVPQDPEFHREGEARRRHARVHRPRERQSGQPRCRQETAEQDHRIQKKCYKPGRRRASFTLAGYILGFPSDTPETIRRDIAIIQEELPLDIIEFFCLTPLPGSEDHQVLWKKGVAMDPDLNKYDRRARLHRASAHEPGAVGGNLPRILVHLLHVEAHGDAAAPRGGDWRTG